MPRLRKKQKIDKKRRDNSGFMENADESFYLPSSTVQHNP